MRKKLRKRQQPTPIAIPPSRYIRVGLADIMRWILVIAVIAGAGYTWHSDWLRVKNIVCDTAVSACDEATLAELNRLKGHHTFLVNSKEIEAKLTKANPTSKEVTVTVILPSTIRVSIKDREPFAQLVIATNSAALVVDKKGFVVAKTASPSPNMASIVSDIANQTSVGDTITDDATRAAITLHQELSRNFITPKEIMVVNTNELIVLLSDGKKAVFNGAINLTSQVNSLQLILAKATIEQEPHTIDVRFAKPVLKYY